MPSQKQTVPLVLASASPRRRELLSTLGIPFQVQVSDIDETPLPGEQARAYVARMATEKAAVGATRMQHALVLAADTSVILDGEILGKPQDPGHARELLRRLSGRAHWVMTGVALAGAFQAHRVVESQVSFRTLTDAEIAWYVASGEPMDKAGAYAVQGAGAALVRRIDGSPSNVIGLPMAETVELLDEAGFPLPWLAGQAL